MKYYPKLKTLCGCVRILDLELNPKAGPFPSHFLLPVPNSTIEHCWAGPMPVEIVDEPTFNAREFIRTHRTEERTRTNLDETKEVITLVIYEEPPVPLKGRYKDALRAIGNRNGQPIPAYIDDQYQIQQYDQRAKDIHNLVAEALKE